MVLMADAGAFDGAAVCAADCAILADTHRGPPGIYTRRECLVAQLRLPLYVVDNGRSLREDVKVLSNHLGCRRHWTSPST